MTTIRTVAASAPGSVTSLGHRLFEIGASVGRAVDFVGATMLGIGRLALSGSPQARLRLVAALRDAGLGSVPIVALLGFVAGFVATLIGAKELGKLGIETGIPRLVGVVVLREIGVLIVGIALAGRVAAAYAAELAAANANGETDALRRSGLAAVDTQVAPRVLALVLAAPVLLAYTHTMAVGGCLLYGAASLAAARENADAMLSALTLKHTLAGFVKAVAFGFAAACAGCYHGLRSSGTTPSAGRAVSRAVVAAVLGVGVAETALIFAFKWIRF